MQLPAYDRQRRGNDESASGIENYNTAAQGHELR